MNVVGVKSFEYKEIHYCNICNQTFDNGVAQHLDSHTAFENICVCRSEFKTSYDLFIHFKNTHIKKCYRCEFCNHTTYSVHEISTHTEHHSMNLD